jgi:hypothetical protein
MKLFTIKTTSFLRIRWICVKSVDRKFQNDKRKKRVNERKKEIKKESERERKR